VQNLKDGTRRRRRNPSSEGNRETGDREWTSAVLKTMEGHLWKTPREAVESSPIQRQRYESVGKDGAKGRGWISQTFNGLREILSAVARSQERKFPRLEAAEAKCNELQHRWGRELRRQKTDVMAAAKRTPAWKRAAFFR